MENRSRKISQSQQNFRNISEMANFRYIAKFRYVAKICTDGPLTADKVLNSK